MLLSNASTRKQTNVAYVCTCSSLKAHLTHCREMWIPAWKSSLYSMPFWIVPTRNPCWAALNIWRYALSRKIVWLQWTNREGEESWIHGRLKAVSTGLGNITVPFEISVYVWFHCLSVAQFWRPLKYCTMLSDVWNNLNNAPSPTVLKAAHWGGAVVCRGLQWSHIAWNRASRDIALGLH